MVHDHEKHHGELIQSLAKEYSHILENSTQGVYIYLDDTHKVCNEKFASMLGYASADAWAAVETNFPDTFVEEKSQEALISAYQEGMENAAGSKNTIVWKKKNGENVKTTVILVPIVFQGHLFALHFVAS